LTPINVRFSSAEYQETEIRFIQMRPNYFTRRQMLSGLGIVAASGVTAGTLTQLHGMEKNASQIAPDSISVFAFGAVGDGKTDDTAAFNTAMQQVKESGNLSVFVPQGRYLIAGHLEIPHSVTLHGVFSAPSGRTHEHGSVLLATAGANDAKGKPFITMRGSSTLRGITVFYPEQKLKNPPVAYPWTIRGQGDNISIIDVLLVNPYQAVDFGTHPAGRHFIRGLYAQPLYRGLFIDQCFDVGRIENIHFWSFWGGWDAELYEFMKSEAIAFIIGRTDWEYLSNCFCIGYKIGFQFVQTAAGSPNCVLTQCGSDIGPVAVKVESCQPHAGLSFVNGQFMAGIEIAETNSGPVKFTSSGFWGIPTTDFHAKLSGTGHTTFNGCHFIGWGQKNTKAPAIHAQRGGVTVTACDFIDLGKAQLTIEKDVDAALIYGNRLRGKELIVNNAGTKAQIALNVVTPK
jgi:hypothetical protein